MSKEIEVHPFYVGALIFGLLVMSGWTVYRYSYKAGERSGRIAGYRAGHEDAGSSSLHTDDNYTQLSNELDDARKKASEAENKYNDLVQSVNSLPAYSAPSTRQPTTCNSYTSGTYSTFTNTTCY